MTYGELEQPVEDKAPAAGAAAIETKHELVQIASQVSLQHPPLVRPEQPPLGEGGDPVYPRKQL